MTPLYSEQSPPNAISYHEDRVPQEEDRGGAEEVSEKKPEVTNEYVLNVAFYTFLIFCLCEAVFAVISGSQSLLEDAEAMIVDALTYLFNLWAERFKHRQLTKEELQMDRAELDYRRELTRLYLELIPPLISVSTLIVVTVLAIQDALETLDNYKKGDEEQEDVDVPIMIALSGLNLLLDVINVTCFARAEQAFGFSQIRSDEPNTRKSYRHSSRLSGRGEVEALLHSPKIGSSTNQNHNHQNTDGEDEYDDNKGDIFVNLNMCSAWTHVCADTLRSSAVLFAATLAYALNIPGVLADSVAEVVVSIIIIISLIPLLQGIYLTAGEVIALKKTNPCRHL